MLTIALIDRHPVVRAGLRFLLHENFKGVSLLEAETADTFRTAFPETIADLILLGFAEPSCSDHLAAIHHISSCYENGMIIVLDEDPNPAAVVSYLKANVRGYLCKQNDTAEILRCIRLVLEGKRYIETKMMEQVMENFLLRTTSVKEKPSLTFKEYEVASYLCAGMPVPLIARKLRRKEANVNTMKQGIYKKLEVRNISALRKLVKTVVLKE